MKTIFTSKDQPIFVDDCDFADLNRWKWKLNKDGYAIRNYRDSEKVWHTELMHRRILGLSLGDGRVGDHRNFLPFDNRRNNLRIATRTQNAAWERRRKNNTSGFKGVYWHKAVGWTAQITINYKRKYLGTFDTAEDAYEFYCLAVDLVHGEFSHHG